MRAAPPQPPAGGVGTTIFAEMSALAVRDRVDQPRPGLPRHRRSGRGARGRRRRDPRRPQPVPARARHPRAARRRRRPPARFYGLAVDPDTEVLVTAGATEAIAAALLALCEPGDEVVVLEPYYDSYAAVHRDGRRRRVARSPCARRDFRPTSTRCAPPITAAHAAAAAQHPAQPDRAPSSPARSSGRSPRWPSSTTCWWSPTRSTSTSPSTAPHIPIATLPGMRERTRHRSPRAARRSRSPAGRSAGLTGPADAGRRPCARPSSS